MAPVLVLIFAFIFISGDNFGQTNCRLRKDEDSIRVYTCYSDTSKFKLIKAEFQVNTTFDQLEKFLLNFSNYTTWQYNTVESRVIKKISDTEYIYYAKIKAPWPVSDRDMVVRFKIVHDESTMHVTANTDTGVPPKKNIVRVPSSHSEWVITKIAPRKLKVNYKIQIDPGGAVPAWLVNWVSAYAPYQSFKDLKKQIADH
ncbi:MAG: hypothetical protein JST43_00275 [Bacteroidetes bacterium]|nr:hypothetical protein [Bacteroidota bacterium]MBS1540816.1 hypothetical protein [Bacteroidota bacterium]